MQRKEVQQEMFPDYKALNKEDERWRCEWKQMPEFEIENKEAIKSILVSFETKEDMESFSNLTGINISMETRGIFFPFVEKKQMEYVDES